MEKITFNFPFTKVNTEKRTVTGIATADNIDQSDEIVDYEASEEAFAKWAGNIREMHGREAVGSAVEYRPTTVTKDGETYRGIEVTAYISKGAQNAWEKVLDKTYKGFSIGGAVLEKVPELNKATGRNATRIKKYTLGELSLVDNPCNQIAQFSMIKMADDGTLEMEQDIHPVYYCTDDHVAKADSNDCPHCETPMKEIGFTQDFTLEAIEKMVGAYELKKVVNARKSPPKGYPKDKSDYADPTNFKYPIDDDHIDAAESYYNHAGQQSAGGYSDSQWKSIGDKIVAALNSLRNGGYSLQDGKIVSKDDSNANEDRDSMTKDISHFGDSDDNGGGEQGPEEYDAGDDDETDDCPWCSGTDGSHMENCLGTYPDSDDGPVDPSPQSQQGGMNKNLQNNNGDDKFNDMELSEKQQMSLIKRFINVITGDDSEPIEKSVEVAPEEVEEKVETVETAPEADTIEKNGGSEDMNIDDLKAMFGEVLDAKLATQKEEIEKSIDEKIATANEAITKSVDAVTEKVETIDEKTALKKSADEVEEDEKIEKNTDKEESFWKGVFIPQEVQDYLESRWG